MGAIASACAEGAVCGACSVIEGASRSRIMTIVNASASKSPAHWVASMCRTPADAPSTRSSALSPVGPFTIATWIRRTVFAEGAVDEI